MQVESQPNEPLPIEAEPQSPSILVVEDEQLVALDIATRLEPLGYTVHTASSGEEAIERATETHPSLILMDIKLSSPTDGIDAAHRIREVMDVPVVYLTAYADETTLERARLTEPYGYILKPFDARELKATIEIVLRKHRTDSHRRRQEEMQRFLSDASARLAESLDYETVVRRATELIVPRYADWCLIALDQPDHLPVLVWSYPDAGDQGQRTTAAEAGVLTSVSHTQRGELHSGLDRAQLSELLGPELQTLRELHLEPHSLICVPLVARGRSVGAILLVSGRNEREYGEFELAIAQDFSSRLAMAIDNALLYRAAQLATQMREEVLAVVSHDLRNALGSITMRAELPPATARNEGIVRTARHMTRLIGDLLDAASIDSGHISLDARPHALAGLVEEAIASLRPLAQVKSIALRAQLPDDRGWVVCDRDRILQVLTNLIGNALKFTPDNGSIMVRAERVGTQIQFAVTDSGPGITADQIPRLFERFWHAGAGQGGAGLGLYIAKGIVEAHGGTIWVDTTVGRGSTFFFTLPHVSSTDSARSIH